MLLYSYKNNIKTKKHCWKDDAWFCVSKREIFYDLCIGNFYFQNLWDSIIKRVLLYCMFHYSQYLPGNLTQCSEYKEKTDLPN